MSLYNKFLYSNTFAKFSSIYYRYFQVSKRKFGYFSKTARVRYPIRIKGIENVYMYDRTHILSGALIIAVGAKFIMKKNSGAAEGLTVVTENHLVEPGEWFLDRGSTNDFIEAEDVVIEEDVWIAANVTLLKGVTVGRGAIVGAGSVVFSNVKAMTIVVGNPAEYLTDRVVE